MAEPKSSAIMFKAIVRSGDRLLNHMGHQIWSGKGAGHGYADEREAYSTGRI
jgi:hypothetical protein